VDLLRHPISPKVRPLLLQAIEKMESGDHEAAIEQLQETLAKYPDSAPYVHNLLGVEYVKTDRFETAIRSFEQAVLLLPHDAMTHYNFGLALVCAGDFERATQEVQRALELDPKNPRMQARLNALLERKHSVN
jgi:Flp pilus assembly protein TadD